MPPSDPLVSCLTVTENRFDMLSRTHAHWSPTRSRRSRAGRRATCYAPPSDRVAEVGSGTICGILYAGQGARMRVALGFLAFLVACEPLPVEDLDGVAFDEGVRLDVHRRVVVEVVGARGDERLVVSLPDGAAVYRGPVGPLAARPLTTSLPAEVDAVRVEVDGDSFEVPVVDGVARIDLAGGRP